MPDASQCITPCLWFDGDAEEAARFYVSLFGNSAVGTVSHFGEAGFEIHRRPAGSVMTVDFQIEGYRFTALNGGPQFRFTPAVSFLVRCHRKSFVDALWGKLSCDGVALMDLDAYPFSERYGWMQDRYGLSWQLMYTGDGNSTPAITPAFMFVGDQCGKAEEAVNFYTTVFQDARLGDIHRYGNNESPNRDGTVKHASFLLEGQTFSAMDSAHDHDFGFNEAISFVVQCESQREIDRYWERLSQGGDERAQQCGWLKDRYGVCWQVVPALLDNLMLEGTPEQSDRLMEALLQMKKLDMAILQEVYEEAAR